MARLISAEVRARRRCVVTKLRTVRLSISELSLAHDVDGRVKVQDMQNRVIDFHIRHSVPEIDFGTNQYSGRARPRRFGRLVHRGQVAGTNG